MFEHDGDEVVDALRGALRSEIKRLLGGEGLAQDHHRIHVGVLHGLMRGGHVSTSILSATQT